MKRLGLIGVGAWGRRYIATVARRQDCRIVAFARATNASAFSLPGAMQCNSWRELLAQGQNGQLDGLVVATTPAHQAEVTHAAVRAGIPILVEKPLGLHAEAATAILHTYVTGPHRPPVVVDHVHLWAPGFRALEGLALQAAAQGDRIVSVSSRGCGNGPVRGWSSLNDYGPHDLAMCLDLLGYDAEFSLEEARVTPGATEGSELFHLKFRLGETVVDVCVGNGAETKSRRFEVELQSGRTFVYDDLRTHPHKIEDTGRSVVIDQGMPLDCVLEDFLRQIDTWIAGRFSEERGRASLQLSARVGSILDQISAVIAAPT